MRYDKRIWKTAAVAAAITIIAGALVMRLGEWSKGLNSEFIAYGQTTGTGGTGGTSGTSGTAAAITQVIPQIAIGSYDGATVYDTFIVIANPSSAPVTVSASFYSQAGLPSTLIGFSTNNATVTSFTGSTASPLTVSANSVLTLTSNTIATGYTAGWGKITTSATVLITAGFEQRDIKTNTLYSRVGIAASPANMQTFAIVRARNEQSTLDTGFAIANTSLTSSATLTATLRDASGNVVATQPITFTAGQQIAEFSMGLFFSKTTEPSFTGTGIFTMTFNSPSPQFAATALVYEGAIDTSFPVIQLQ